MKYLLVLFFAIVYEIDASCPNGTFSNNATGRCYFIPKGSMQFLLAETSCKDQNGNLASISDSHVNYYLRAANIKPQKSQPLKTGRKPSGTNYLDMAKQILGSNVTVAWLGGRKDKNGTWIWLDGQNFSYTNWARGSRKNNTWDNCMGLRLSNGQWYSFSCYDVLPYICELSQTTTMTTNSSFTTITSTTTSPTAPTTATTITHSPSTITSITANPTTPTTTTITNSPSITITSTTTKPTTPTTTITNSPSTTITSTTTKPTTPTTTITNSPSTTIISTTTKPTKSTTTTITNSSSTTITSTTTNPTAPTTTFTPLSTTDPKHSNYRNWIIFSCVGIFIFIFTTFMLIYCILRYRGKKRRAFRLDGIEMQVQSTVKGKPQEFKKLDNFGIGEKRLEVKYEESLGTGFSSNIYN